MKTIFYDVDTQNDFMNADGALYVPTAEHIKPNLAKLTRYACEKGIPIFGSVDRHFGTPEYKHREGELKINGGPFPFHCMNGTNGQRKIAETFVFMSAASKINCYSVVRGFISHSLENEKQLLRTKDPYKEDMCIDDTILGSVVRTFFLENTGYDTDGRFVPELYFAQGIFFEKQHYDVSTNPWFEKVMKAITPETAIVYGVATDYCVKAGALALKKAGVPAVYVVTDAIRAITLEGEKLALEEMATVGIQFTTTKAVLEGKVEVI